MKVDLSQRAKERGFAHVEILKYHEGETYIACVLYEKRIKNKELVEEVRPAIIFKTDIKHGDYEQAVRLAEKAGIYMIFPDDQNFRTDYYGLEFMGGYKTIVRSWGYVANHLPRYRRWKRYEIEKTAEVWLEDMVKAAEVIQHVVKVMEREPDLDKQIEEIQQYFMTDENIKPFMVA